MKSTVKVRAIMKSTVKVNTKAHLRYILGNATATRTSHNYDNFGKTAHHHHTFEATILLI